MGDKGDKGDQGDKGKDAANCREKTFSGSELAASGQKLWDYRMTGDQFCSHKIGYKASMKSFKKCFMCVPGCNACRSVNTATGSCDASIATCHAFSSITCHHPDAIGCLLHKATGPE